MIDPKKQIKKTLSSLFPDSSAVKPILNPFHYFHKVKSKVTQLIATPCASVVEMLLWQS